MARRRIKKSAVFAYFMACRSQSRGFPKYCIDLLNRVEYATGVPLSLTSIDSSRPFEPSLHIAFEGAPTHRLLYWSGLERHRTHYAVKAAYEILRLWEVPSNERMVPVMKSADRLTVEFAHEMREAFPDPGAALVNAAGTVVGIGRQVTNYPLDLCVERDIHRGLYRHRVAQQKCLQEQSLGIVGALRQPVFQRMPQEVRKTIAVLHLSYARSIATIAGIEDLSFLFPEYAHDEIINELVQQFLASSATTGHTDDRALIDSWASALNLREWYEWQPLHAK